MSTLASNWVKIFEVDGKQVAVTKDTNQSVQLPVITFTWYEDDYLITVSQCYGKTREERLPARDKAFDELTSDFVSNYVKDHLEEMAAFQNEYDC